MTTVPKRVCRSSYWSSLLRNRAKSAASQLLLCRTGLRIRSRTLLGCSLDGESKLFYHLVAHPKFLNLSRNRHREFGRETDVARHLVGRDLAAAIISNLIGGGGLAIAQPNPGAHFLAIFGVGHTDHLSIADLGMCVEEFFRSRVDRCSRRRG